MRITFWHSDKPRERLLADAWADGARLAGDQVELRRLEPEPVAAECEVAVMFGVKSRELYRVHWQAGAHIVYVDKGYTRHKIADPTGLWEYWRVAVDAHHPTSRLMERNCPPDRWERLGLHVKDWRAPHARQPFLLAGSSAKYHQFYGLSDPTEWAGKVIRVLRAHFPERPVIYRPKPSWKDAVPIADSVYSDGSQQLDELLRDCYALVTHGSNAVFEACLAGVPTVVLGDAVTRPISTTELGQLTRAGDPYIASREDRTRLLRNLAYFQWTLAEIARGDCWRFIRPMIYGRAQ